MLSRQSVLGGAALLALLIAACSGTTVPFTFEGEPVCPDFLRGSEEVRGGLKKPLSVTFKDGSEVIARVVLVGLPKPGSPATPILLPDADAEYDVDWAECENERAPGTVTKGRPFDTKYECGEAKSYATTKVSTKKGSTSRSIAVTPPASPVCWTAP